MALALHPGDHGHNRRGEVAALVAHRGLVLRQGLLGVAEAGIEALLVNRPDGQGHRRRWPLVSPGAAIWPW